jgi:hypothetical protein
MRIARTSAAIVLCVLSAGVVKADIIGTYVDSGSSNTTGSGWSLRNDYGESSTVYECETAGDELTTTVSVANGTYNIYAVYWTTSNSTWDQWAISASLAGNTLTGYGVLEGTATGHTAQGGNLIERQALLGQVAVTSGSFAVDVKSIGALNGYNVSRGWYDGVSYQAIPEPSAIILLGCGLIGLLAYAWRKRA